MIGFWTGAFLGFAIGAFIAMIAMLAAVKSSMKRSVEDRNAIQENWNMQFNHLQQVREGYMAIAAAIKELKNAGN